MASKTMRIVSGGHFLLCSQRYRRLVLRLLTRPSSTTTTDVARAKLVSKRRPASPLAADHTTAHLSIRSTNAAPAHAESSSDTVWGTLLPISNNPPLVTCQPGLETILSEELSYLSVPHSPTDQRHILRLTDLMSLEQIHRCHLHLGTASQVLLPLHEPFRARGLPQLQRKVERLLPWGELFGKTHERERIQLQVKVASSKSKLLHTVAIRDCILGAIHSSLGVRSGEGHDADSQHGNEPYVTITLQVSVVRDVFRIALQSTSTPLHQRGYRFQVAKAPLREDLAYALLYSSGWTAKGWTQGICCFDGFWDPFCGSGTIAIEAAAVACGMPPGRLRSAPFEGTALENTQLWKKLLQESINDRTGSVRLFASDRDKGAIEIATSNARRAGVLERIEFEQSAVSNHVLFNDLLNPPSRLLVATNLPFGRRISRSKKLAPNEDHSLLPLYQTLTHKVMLLKESGIDVKCMALINDILLARKGFHGMGIETKLRTMHGGMQAYGLLSS